MSEYNNEMTEEEIEREKEERRAAIRAEIERIQGLINRLKEFQGQLEEQHENTLSSVYGPTVEYDLTASDSIAHWAGELEVTGEEKKGLIAEAVDGFCGGITNNITLILELIREFEDQIADLQAQLAAI